MFVAPVFFNERAALFNASRACLFKTLFKFAVRAFKQAFCRRSFCGVGGDGRPVLRKTLPCNFAVGSKFFLLRLGGLGCGARLRKFSVVILRIAEHLFQPGRSFVALGRQSGSARLYLFHLCRKRFKPCRTGLYISRNLSHLRFGLSARRHLLAELLYRVAHVELCIFEREYQISVFVRLARQLFIDELIERRTVAESAYFGLQIFEIAERAGIFVFQNSAFKLFAEVFVYIRFGHCGELFFRRFALGGKPFKLGAFFRAGRYRGSVFFAAGVKFAYLCAVAFYSGQNALHRAFGALQALYLLVGAAVFKRFFGDGKRRFKRFALFRKFFRLGGKRNQLPFRRTLFVGVLNGVFAVGKRRQNFAKLVKFGLALFKLLQFFCRGEVLYLFIVQRRERGILLRRVCGERLLPFNPDRKGGLLRLLFGKFFLGVVFIHAQAARYSGKSRFGGALPCGELGFERFAVLLKVEKPFYQLYPFGGSRVYELCKFALRKGDTLAEVVLVYAYYFGNLIAYRFDVVGNGG